MEIIDPFKETRRKLAQKNAEKVRTKPLDYVDKSVRIVNKWEGLVLEKNVGHMQKSGKLFSQNIDRDKKQFVHTARKKLRYMIPGLRKRYNKNDNGEGQDSELVRIIKFYEEKNPKAVKHAHSDQDLRQIKGVHNSNTGRVKLDPINKQLSSSLQDLRIGGTMQTDIPKKRSRKNNQPPSRLEILDENLSVPHLKYSNRPHDMSTESLNDEEEKEELRKRNMGVTSCPAFFLETGVTNRHNLSRESPFKVHSSMAMSTHHMTDMSEDEDDVTTAAASTLFGNFVTAGSRATSRTTNRFETPTPGPYTKTGRDSRLSMDTNYERQSKLSMSNDVAVKETGNGMTRGFGTGELASSPIKRNHSRNARVKKHNNVNNDMEDDFNQFIKKVEVSGGMIPSASERSGHLRGRSLNISQESDKSSETLGSSISARIYDVTHSPKRQRVNGIQVQGRMTSSPIQTKTLFYPALSNSKYSGANNTASAVSASASSATKPAAYPKSQSNNVRDTLDKHLHPVPPPGKKVLPKIVATDLPINIVEDQQNIKKLPSDKNLKSNPEKGRKSPTKLYKNNNLVTQYYVPSDIKKVIAGVSFDPYMFALNQDEINDIESKKRHDHAEAKINKQKEAVKTAQGNVQDWIQDVDNQIKCHKEKYLTS